MTDSKKKWLPILKKAAIFANLAEEEITVLASSMFFCEFETERSLVYEGESGNELFFILEGSVCVSVKSQGKEIELVTLKAGDFFGEMAMLEQELRSATCRSVETTRCLVMKSRDFSEIIINHPAIAVSVLNNMLKITSLRLLKTDSLVSEIVQWGEAAKKRAITDSFTGLYNRRYFDEYFEVLINGGMAKHLGVSFAMVDIDHFGTLNKNYGSVFCDKVLLDVVEVFKQSFDTNDILIRYGGDEFCFIIQDEFEKAEVQCSNVCKNVYALTFSEHEGLHVSCSIGLVHYRKDLKTEQLLSFSDKALYKAKEDGRNRLHIFNP